MQSSNNSALEYIKNTFTRDAQQAFGATETVELQLHRNEFKNFIEEQEQKYFCKFYNRTSSSNQRQQKNKEYLSNGYQPDNTAEQNTSIPAKRGRPVAVFSETYICSHGVKPASNAKKSIFCGCQASIKAVVYDNAENLNIIDVTYTWKHTGHTPNSNDEVRRGPLPNFVSTFIKQQVEQNMTWYNIKNMLRLDKNILAQLLSDQNENVNTNVPLSLSVKYHHIYYAINKVMEKRARLDQDFVTSLNLWSDKIVNDNVRGYFTSKNLEAYESGMFFVSFMSDWQLGILRKDGDLVSLDSTHKTCIDGAGKDCYLYTLVARCQVTGKGKPLVWMITNSESQYPIKYWLLWLQEQFSYRPAKVMIDNSDTEIAAINGAYNSSLDLDLDGENVNSSAVEILLCHWHILRAWKKNILTKVTAKPSNPKKTLKQKSDKRDEALDWLVNLMHSVDEEDFDLDWENYDLWTRENTEEWETEELFEYFQREYLPKRENWSKAWRRGTYHIDTNNYIESWHRHLKEVYMHNLKKQRVDSLIYVLWELVLPDFMQDHIRTVAGIANRRINDAERKRIQAANSLNEEQASASIRSQTENTVSVASFTDEDVQYDVLINPEDNRMISCTCLDHQTTKSSCKHMYLVNRVLNIGLLLKDQHLPAAEFAFQRQEQMQELEEEVNEDELLDEELAGWGDFAAEFSNYQAEWTRANYGVRSRPELARIRGEMKRLFNEAKAWRNNIFNSLPQHQRRF